MTGVATSNRSRTRAVGRIVAVAAVLLASLVTITAAQAQVRDDRYPGMQRPPSGGGGGFFRSPFRLPWDRQPQRYEPPRPQQPPPQVDYSKAPPPAKRDTPASVNIVVMGDSMADWLAYGLEEAFADSTEFGVTRKHRTSSSLIRNESRDAYDWAQSAREILANEPADFVVMMIGLADRQPIRERPKPAPPASNGDQPAIAAPETGPAESHEFRSEKWVELYTKRLDEVIAALKSKGVPVLWVGMPAIRGTRSTSEMVFLNDLFRARAEKAGITYVDVWDGFVDEDGAFTVHGPDFNGQIRRLRTGDGVHFTKAGARKLAHYVEREIQRVIQARGTAVALPVPDEPQPQGTDPAAPRPVAGPVVPLTGETGNGEALLGGGRNPALDPLASRVLVRGEALSAQEGRADDFSWPRREPTEGEVIPPVSVPVQASRPPAARPPASPSRPAAARR